ncbi:MAG: hypothetical protein MJ175_02835 [Clostridia bacterium]|nr:hypothetical protein [Clostridia bacterium]
MAENRNALCGCQGNTTRSGCGGNTQKESVYIDVNRILDSCRDRDCFEGLRVYLPDFGQEIIDRASSVRVRSAEIVDTCIHVSPMTFNRGFYQITMRIYVRLEIETCVSGKPQCVEGLAIAEKNVILFGSEGSVKIFRSKSQDEPCCECYHPDGDSDDNLPTAVLEIVDPVVLAAKIEERCKCSCPCSCCDIPERVAKSIGGSLYDSPEIEKVLTVSLGFFSVVRMERPAQFLVTAAEYAVPDKECVYTDDDDPCAAFRRMSFPVEQFAPPAYAQCQTPCGTSCAQTQTNNNRGCGCFSSD